jgi:8-oxo-dGTP diphosphatase
MRGPTLTVDVIIEFPDGEIVLVKRGIEPFKGHWAIPGGHVESGETVEQAAVREIKEETGLNVRLDGIAGVYSDPNRDPRGHTASVVYHAVPTGGIMAAETDAEDVIKTKDIFKYPLAFDHKKILEDWIKNRK